MNLELRLKNGIVKALFGIYGQIIEPKNIALQPTKKEFEGTFTFVTFGLSKDLRIPPALIAEQLGKYLLENEGI